MPDQRGTFFERKFSLSITPLSAILLFSGSPCHWSTGNKKKQ